MNLKELREKRAAAVTRAKALHDKENRTPEEDKALDLAVEEMKALKEQIEALEKKAAIADEIAKEFQALSEQPKPKVSQEIRAPGKPVQTPEDRVFARAKRYHCKNFKGPDAGERAFRMGMFLAATVYESRRAAKWCHENGLPIVREEPEERTNMVEGTNYLGGALVPDEFEDTIIDLREQYGVIRRLSRVMPMARDTKSIPRRVQGVTAYPVGEGAALTVSNKKWDTVGLVAKKWGCLSILSKELNEDAVVNLGDDMAGEMGQAFAYAEDNSAFNGDGTSTYHGLTGIREKIKGLSGTIANIAGLFVGTGNAYSELTLTDFESVVGLLPTYADTRNAAWICNKNFYWNVMVRLALAAGGVTQRETLDGPGRGRPIFLGYPVELTSCMPKDEANSQVCCLLGDLALGTKFGDRRGMTVEVSTEAYVDSQSLFEKDLMAVKSTERWDFVCHDVGNADATAANRVPGPIVGLITKSS